MTARFVVAYTETDGSHNECGNHTDRAAAQRHADRLNAQDPSVSACVVDYTF